MLSSLQIENFKGIKSGTISNLSQVNVLVGRNNSGKSTVLDALLLMRCAFADRRLPGTVGLNRCVTGKSMAMTEEKTSESLLTCWILRSRLQFAPAYQTHRNASRLVVQGWSVGPSSLVPGYCWNHLAS